MRRRIRVHDGDEHAESHAAVPPEAVSLPEAAADAAAANSEVEALLLRVQEMEAQVSAERDQALRTLAEFKNFRRRTDEQRTEVSQFANRELVLGLLPILDNLERAVNSADRSQSFEALADGVKLTLRQIHDYLKKNGVEPVEAVGAEFDPNFHEAVMRDEESDLPDNTVTEELRRGFMMHGRVLRPAMVKVAKGG